MLEQNTNSVSRFIQNVDGGFVIDSSVIKNDSSKCRLPVIVNHKRIFSTLEQAEGMLRDEAKKVAQSRKFILSWNNRFSFTVDKTNGENWVLKA